MSVLVGPLQNSLKGDFGIFRGLKVTEKFRDGL